jgi:hypothetical protein
METLDTFRLCSILAGLAIAISGCCFGEAKRSPEELRAEMATQEPFSTEFETNRTQLVAAVNDATISGIQGYVPVTSDQAPPAQVGSQTAFVDPSTGKVAWRALACFNPQCAGNGKGGLVMLAKPYSNLRAGSSGELIVAPPNMEEYRVQPTCPVCGKSEYIRPYETPEATKRRHELEAELRASYAAYAKAAKSKIRPEGVRSPETIMNDLASLKNIFLVP